MTKEQNERLVVCFELIAKSLGGLHEEIARAGKRYWPEPGQQRESVLTHVENEEDRAKKSLGLTDQPIDINKWLEPDWLDDSEEYIGERSAQWIKDHPPEKAKVADAGSEVASKGQESGTSTEEVESEA